MNWLHLGLFLFLIYIVVQNGFAVKESFAMKDANEESYIFDVTFVKAYVGPFLGDIYTTLRAKNFNTTVEEVPYSWKLTPGDKNLTDGLLPLARAQVISWIDSFDTNCNVKYSAADLLDFKKKNDLEYVKNADNSLTVNLVSDGVSTSYVL